MVWESALSFHYVFPLLGLVVKCLCPLGHFASPVCLFIIGILSLFFEAGAQIDQAGLEHLAGPLELSQVL